MGNYEYKKSLITQPYLQKKAGKTAKLSTKLNVLLRKLEKWNFIKKESQE